MRLVADRPTDRPTDRQSDIVTYKAAIAAKNALEELIGMKQVLNNCIM